MSDQNFTKIRFCIPSLGTKVVLAEGWTFNLHYERRNKSLIEKAGLSTPNCWYTNRNGCAPMTLPAGTKLMVDRIYIRRPFKDFDSVTFRIEKDGCPDKAFCSVRFWAKLRDVNKISCLPMGDDSELAELESFLGLGRAVLKDRYDFIL